MEQPARSNKGAGGGARGGRGRGSRLFRASEAAESASDRGRYITGLSAFLE